MSTNKTQNYHLHSWLPDDEFHVSEVNENFAALDRELALETEALQDAFADEVGELRTTLAGKAEVVFGRYEHSNTANLAISLGRRPTAVLIENYRGARGLNDPYGILLMEGGSDYYAKITEDGFIILRPEYLNSSGGWHVYMAFFLG